MNSALSAVFENMQRRTIRMRRQITALALVASIATGALAQTSTTIDAAPTNLCVRGGVFLPIDDDLRNVDDVMFGLGFDIIFDQQYIKGSTTYLSADWVGRTLKGDRGNFFPICINQKFPIGKKGGFDAYAFGGAGISIVDIVDSDTAFTLRGGLGIDLGPAAFVEGTFYWSDKMNLNPRITGFGVYLGYRF